MSEEKRTIVTKDTLVPISLLAGIITLIFAAASSFVWLKTSLHDIQTKIANIETKLDSAAKDNVSQKDLKNWIKLLKLKNPTISVEDF